MPRIVPAILSLSQHQDVLEREAVIYRPSACPHCGLARLWGHGCYVRKADRRPEPSGSMNPVSIPRFYCQGCRQTCSRLPECVAPRRWYGWALQQIVLLCLLGGGSLHQAAAQGGVDRHTARRWWRWLKERGAALGSGLRARFPELGRAVDFAGFWQGCWEAMPLSRAMAWFDLEGKAVPCRLDPEGMTDGPFGSLIPPHTLCPLSGAGVGGFHGDPFNLIRSTSMKAVDPVALFRLSVLGPLVSRDRLERGELRQIIRELALREYAIPGSRRQ